MFFHIQILKHFFISKYLLDITINNMKISIMLCLFEGNWIMNLKPRLQAINL